MGAAMSSGQLRSYLAGKVSASMDCDRVKREAWRDDGNLVMMHDQIAALPLSDRQTLERIASRQYGVKTLKG